MSVLLVVVLACLGGRASQTEDGGRRKKSAAFEKGSGPILSAQQIETKSAARKKSVPWISNLLNPHIGALLSDMRSGSLRLGDMAGIRSSATERGGLSGRDPPAVS